MKTRTLLPRIIICTVPNILTQNLDFIGIKNINIAFYSISITACYNIIYIYEFQDFILNIKTCVSTHFFIR